MNQIPKSNHLPTWNTHSVDALRPFAEIQLVVVDLDGTLLANSKAGVAPALQRLKRSLRMSRQVKLTIATGRALAGVTALLVDLELDRTMPIIVYNGALVVRPDGNQVISRELISPDAAQEVINLGHSHSVNVLAYAYGSTTFLTSEAVEEKVYGWVGNPQFKTDINGIPVSWQCSGSGTQELWPVAILIDLRSSPQLLPTLRQQVEKVSGISVTISGSNFLECRAENCNKGTALATLADYMGLEDHQILAVGDNDNDAEMLEFAGSGICVSGASEKAKISSDYICRYGVVRGVIEALHVVRQAKRYFHESTYKGAW